MLGALVSPLRLRTSLTRLVAGSNLSPWRPLALPLSFAQSSISLWVILGIACWAILRLHVPLSCTGDRLECLRSMFCGRPCCIVRPRRLQSLPLVAVSATWRGSDKPRWHSRAYGLKPSFVGFQVPNSCGMKTKRETRERPHMCRRANPEHVVWSLFSLICLGRS